MWWLAITVIHGHGNLCTGCDLAGWLVKTISKTKAEYLKHIIKLCTLTFKIGELEQFVNSVPCNTHIDIVAAVTCELLTQICHHVGNVAADF